MCRRSIYNDPVQYNNAVQAIKVCLVIIIIKNCISIYIYISYVLNLAARIKHAKFIERLSCNVGDP